MKNKLLECKVPIAAIVNNRIRPDGFFTEYFSGTKKAEKTVVEFDGCHWHACSCMPNNAKKTYSRTTRYGQTVILNSSQVRAIDRCKNDIYEKRGYKCIRMKECRWKKIKEDNASIAKYLKEHPLRQEDKKLQIDPEHPFLTYKDTILDGIRKGEVFGITICDIHVPDNKKEYFKEFAPIIKHANINFKDIGEYMQDVAKNSDITVKDRRSVIDSYFGKEVGLIDSYLRWLLEKGLIVTKIHMFIRKEANF